MNNNVDNSVILYDIETYHRLNHNVELTLNELELLLELSNDQSEETHDINLNLLKMVKVVMSNGWEFTEKQYKWLLSKVKFSSRHSSDKEIRSCYRRFPIESVTMIEDEPPTPVQYPRRPTRPPKLNFNED